MLFGISELPAGGMANPSPDSLIRLDVDFFDASVVDQILKSMLTRKQSAVDAGTDEHAAMSKDRYVAVRLETCLLEERRHAGVELGKLSPPVAAKCI
jgi:hypothetical protein